MDKPSARHNYRCWRQSLTPAAYNQLSDRLWGQLGSFLAQNLAVGATVLAYYPHHQEPDILPLLHRDIYRWGLPRCLPHQQLAWHQWRGGDPLVVGAYGLLEPDAALPLVEQAAALVIPALAMDRQGYRLGYGGGYFDRLLATPAGQNLLTIGVTFAATWVDRLPRDDWDLPLQVICTESAAVWAMPSLGDYP